MRSSESDASSTRVVEFRTKQSMFWLLGVGVGLIFLVLTSFPTNLIAFTAFLVLGGVIGAKHRIELTESAIEQRPFPFARVVHLADVEDAIPQGARLRVKLKSGKTVVFGPLEDSDHAAKTLLVRASLRAAQRP